MLPELSYNIAQTQFHLKNVREALIYCDQAVSSSQQILDILKVKLDKPSAKDMQSQRDQEEYSNMYIDQVDILIKSLMFKGKIYITMDQNVDAKREYN